LQKAVVLKGVLDLKQKKNILKKALEYAIQMEIDGKAFYAEVAASTMNKFGSKLFSQLAQEEDGHIKRFERIFTSISHREGWPIFDIPVKGSGVKTIFKKSKENLQSPPTSSELEAVAIAINMEQKSYDFYKDREEQSISEAEKDFFASVAAEERQHHLALVDYHEYISDPATYFIDKEHPSLDGS
jgi:rubrerythrin